MVSEALSIVNHCQRHMKQKPSTKLRDLLKSKKAKTRKLSELFKTEQSRLAKLNGMLDELGVYKVCVTGNGQYIT